MVWRVSHPLCIPLLSACITIALSACNKPPTRSFLVKGEGGNGQSESPGTGHETETVESGDSEPETTAGSQNQTPTDPAPKPSSSDPKPDTSTTTPTNPSMPDPEIKPDPKPEGPQTLVECPNKLSVGRIHQWHATSEGVMIPQSGLIVVKDGEKNVAKVEFVGEGWHVVPVWLKNAFQTEVDLSKSKNFTITYSATSDLYVQLRPAFAWDGGDKWAARLPSTGGEMKTLTVSFEDPAAWSAPLGQPPHTLDAARAKARGFVFVGNKPNKIAVTSLLFDGYEPPCE